MLCFVFDRTQIRPFNQRQGLLSNYSMITFPIEGTINSLYYLFLNLVFVAFSNKRIASNSTYGDIKTFITIFYSLNELSTHRTKCILKKNLDIYFPILQRF